MKVQGVTVNSKDHSKSLISDYVAAGFRLVYEYHGDAVLTRCDEKINIFCLGVWER
jgi:hypothetical protein